MIPCFGRFKLKSLDDWIFRSKQYQIKISWDGCIVLCCQIYERRDSWAISNLIPRVIAPSLNDHYSVPKLVLTEQFFSSIVRVNLGGYVFEKVHANVHSKITLIILYFCPVIFVKVAALIKFLKFSLKSVSLIIEQLQGFSLITGNCLILLIGCFMS